MCIIAAAEEFQEQCESHIFNPNNTLRIVTVSLLAHCQRQGQLVAITILVVMMAANYEIQDLFCWQSLIRHLLWNMFS